MPSPSDPSRLGPDERKRSLSRMADEVFDVIIIGGGVTGCGCALDAAGRGLSVGLVEQRDLASGTSSRSSKLIHGGLRYLEKLEFSLVREALRERTLMLTRLAPHLVRPVSFIYPLRHRGWERVYVGAGVLLYDVLAAARSNPLPRHRHLGRRAALEAFPALEPGYLVGAVQYWDAQVDDARHTVALARTAAERGAAIATSTRAVGFVRDGARVTGVRAVDLESGDAVDIRGRVVINATGVWSDHLELLAGDTVENVTAAKGVHLVIPGERIEGGSGLITRTPTSVLFIVPFDRHWIVGTTDTPWRLDLAHPAASLRDIDYLLEQTNRVLRVDLGHDDIVGVYAGLRPLVSGDAARTEKLSREHSVTSPVPGLVSIIGGKYTTYRVMAADTVDVAGRMLAGTIPGSSTTQIPLVGAVGYEAMAAAKHRIARPRGLSVEQLDRLLGRYGSRVDDLLGLIRGQPELAQPVAGAEAYLAAEIHYAVTHEAALHLDDVLTRRTRVSIQVPDRGLAAAESVAQLMGPLLGWSASTVQRELVHYRARVAAERESQTMPDDHTADAARMGAPDVRGQGP